MLFRDPIPGYAVFCVLAHIGTVEITEDGVDEGSLIGIGSLRGQHVQLDQLYHRPYGLGFDGGLCHGGVLEQGEGVLDGRVQPF